MVEHAETRRFARALGLPFCTALLLCAPFVLSEFRLNLIGRYLTYAIVAIGLDLIWGYGGMLSLGQGLFFGLGAYSMAMYLKLESSGGQLPDFMSWSGRDTLPAFWQPFHSPIFALLAAVAIPALVAGLLGYMVFRSRIQGVYFSLITQALTLIAGILFIGQQAVSGGTNGITNLKTIFGFSRTSASTQIVIYVVTVLVLMGIYLFCRWLTTSRFGRLLVALRDDEARVRFLGYDPAVLKTLIFALSAGIAGIAGALFVCLVGIISPSALGVTLSVEMVIWVAVGGRGTLTGPVIGALLVNLGKSGFSESYPEVWQYFFGALFIGTVLLFPEGLVGLLRTGAMARLSALRRRLLLAVARSPVPLGNPAGVPQTPPERGSASE
jgi:urea transport system permease protein